MWGLEGAYYAEQPLTDPLAVIDGRMACSKLAVYLTNRLALMLAVTSLPTPLPLSRLFTLEWLRKLGVVQ